MTTLEIAIDDGRTGQRVVRFDQSPVTIGRASTNQVALPAPWVSSRHGEISFDERGIRYRDLGSRNGTWVQGPAGRRRAPANESIELGEGDALYLGVGVGEPDEVRGVTLAIRRASVPTSASRTPSSAGKAGTIVMPSAEAAQYAAISRERVEPPSGGVVAPTPMWPSSNEAPTPQHGSRPATGSEGLSLWTSHETLRALLPAGATDVDRARVAVALARLCEAFARGMLALGSAHRAVAEEIGVRAVGTLAGQRDARSPSELVASLIQGGELAPQALADVARIFDDLSIHEVALLRGIREGVKALVDKLDPEAEFKESETERGGLRLFENRFDRYVEFFKQTTEDDGQSVVFGSDFAEGYGQVIASRDDER